MTITTCFADPQTAESDERLLVEGSELAIRAIRTLAIRGGDLSRRSFMVIHASVPPGLQKLAAGEGIGLAHGWSLLLTAGDGGDAICGLVAVGCRVANVVIPVVGLATQPGGTS